LSIQVTFCEGADKTLDSALAPQKKLKGDYRSRFDFAL
jgi:hypothetical protein